nr:hypothetical protein BaRGS_005105 [Batillaria attramentaria]
MTTGTAANKSNNSDGCCVSFVTTTPEMIQPELPPFMRGEGLLTEDDYIRLSQTVKMTVAPILLLGIITNTVSILVYLRMPASVTSTFFSLASGLDILYLLTLCPTTFMSLVVGQEQAVRSVFYIYYVTYVSNYVTYTTRKVIVCVTMLMSLDRYLVVAFPIRIRSLEHLRRPKSYTFLVTFLVYLFDINLAFKNKVVVTDQTAQATHNACQAGDDVCAVVGIVIIITSFIVSSGVRQFSRQGPK